MLTYRIGTKARASSTGSHADGGKTPSISCTIYTMYIYYADMVEDTVHACTYIHDVIIGGATSACTCR